MPGREHPAPGSGRGRWWTRGRRWAPARRSARTCTSPAASASAACWSRRRPRDHRRRRLRRLARDRHRGRPHRRGGRDRPQRRPQRLRADHRRPRHQARGVPRWSPHGSSSSGRARRSSRRDVPARALIVGERSASADLKTSLNDVLRVRDRGLIRGAAGARGRRRPLRSELRELGGRRAADAGAHDRVLPVLGIGHGRRARIEASCASRCPWLS